MSSPSDGFTSIVQPEVSAYVNQLAGDDDPLAHRLEAFALERGFPLVGRASGRVLELLTTLVGGRRVFEFGSGFGFSAFYFARAVGDRGEVIGAEKDAWEIEAFERLFWRHPFRHRIQIGHGDAAAIFRATKGAFDVVFLDLHKAGYLDALELALPRVRSGGLILADNVLWGGKTARPAADADTAALQRFNERIFQHERLSTTILPVGDGLSLSRVR